ncbi:MAG: DUF6483 family protein [Bacillota bacterium]|nr:DUF6483 family protein [Bacillota bacterium]
MFKRNDYIMDLIEQISMAIADIMGLRKEKKYAEVQRLVDVNLKKFLGLTEETVHRLSHRDLMNIISVNNEYDISKCIIMAELLNQEGENFEDQGDTAASFNMYVKSMNIFIEILLLERDEFLRQYYERVEELADKLKEYELPPESRMLLFKYYEMTGSYGKAEDMLFEMLEMEDRNPEAAEMGISFYERLTGLEEEVLIKGNLPLNEVSEGMRKLKRYCGIE